MSETLHVFSSARNWCRRDDAIVQLELFQWKQKPLKPTAFNLPSAVVHASHLIDVIEALRLPAVEEALQALRHVCRMHDLKAWNDGLARDVMSVRAAVRQAIDHLRHIRNKEKR